MEKPDEYLEFANRKGWRAWLEAHHAEAREAWVAHYRKGVREGALSYEQGVEEALCFGWIDGLLRKIDAERFILRYSPRRRKSIWSESNKRRAERLIAEGRMSPAGLAKIAEAQASGEWEAATQREDVSAIPPDLEQALRTEEGALAAFFAWPDSRKKQYLWWIASARRAETRARRVQSVVQMALAQR